MKTRHNLAHVSIAFLGDYRPAYFVGKSTTEAVIIALSAISDEKIAKKLKNLSWQFVKENKRGMRLSALSSESYDNGSLSISINDRPHDPWLGSVMGSMLKHEGIDYSKSE